jgi:large subunit ribosomal protein L35
MAAKSAKMKTHKGVKKRFRLSANGKVKYKPCGNTHRNVRVSAKRKRNMRGNDTLNEVMAPKIRRALGKYSN